MIAFVLRFVTQRKSQVYDQLLVQVGLDSPQLSQFDVHAMGGDRADDGDKANKFHEFVSPFWNLQAIAQGFFAQVPQTHREENDPVWGIIGGPKDNRTTLYLLFGANTGRRDQWVDLFRLPETPESDSVLESFFTRSDASLELEEEERTGQCSHEG